MNERPDDVPEWVPSFSEDADARSLVFEALGAASMCWDNPGGAGVFHAYQAESIGEELCRRLGIGDPEGES